MRTPFIYIFLLLVFLTFCLKLSAFIFFPLLLVVILLHWIVSVTLFKNYFERNFFCYGISLLCVLFSLHFQATSDDTSIFDLPAFQGKQSVMARVCSLPKVYSSGKKRNVFFEARLKKIFLFDEKSAVDEFPWSEIIKIAWFHAGEEMPVIGDEIVFYGHVTKLKKKMNNYERTFQAIRVINEPQYLIRGYGTNALSLRSLQKNVVMHWIAQLRKSVLLRIELLWKNPEIQSYFKALLLGQKNSISKKDRNAFANAGVAHLLVVSGLHVTLMSGLVAFTLFLLGYDSPKVAILVGMFVVFYAVLSGLGLPVIRATLMSLIILFSYLFKRNTETLNILFFIASAMILISPNVIFDVAFQLSFLSVFGLIVMRYRSLRAFVDFRYSLANSSFVVIEKTATVFLFTLPILALYFNKISILAFIANIIAIPLVSTSVFFAFLAFFSCGFEMLSSFCAIIAETSLTVVIEFIRQLENFPIYTTALKTPSLIHVFLYYFYLNYLIFEERIFLNRRGDSARRYAWIALCILSILFIFSFKTETPSFTFFSTPKNFICFLEFDSHQKWMLEYKRGASKSIDRSLIEPHIKARKLKGMTGLLTSKRTLKLIEGKEGFFKNLFLTSSKKKSLNENNAAQLLSVGDWIEVGDKTEIRVLFIKGDEAFWLIKNDQFSMAILPDFSEEFNTSYSALKSKLDLLVYAPENRPLRSELKKLESIFEPQHMIVTKSPYDRTDQNLAQSHAYFLDQSGQISLISEDKQWTYKFYREIGDSFMS